MPAAPVPGRGAEPGPGDILAGRYEIQGELGRGGMATVYRGRDLRLQRRVAIKVFRGGIGDAVDPRRTTQEMRLLARVDHPSVVSVLDASTGDGAFGAFLVMELVAGDDLGALLHRARGALAADFARRIVADVAGALQALHAQGVVHRDVKPANILVPTDAMSPHAQVSAKLTDFGIAQLVDDARLTDPESVLGTAAYLSPEQVRGLAPQPASDVYSLGLVLLEALTGRRAFPGPAAEAAMARLQRPPALPPGASPVLADLLSRMTALDPAERPAAGEVATALREQLVGRVTAPDAVQTAPTPIAGVPRVAEAAPVDADATLVHPSTWTPSTGMPIVTGAQPTALRPAVRRPRTPAVLAVAASVLAAGVAVAAISAASSTQAPDATGGGSGGRSSAPQAGGTAGTGGDGAAAHPVVVLPGTGTRHTPSPTPGPSGSTPAPTPTPTSTPTAPGPSPTTGKPTAPVVPPPPVEPSDPPSTPADDPPSDTPEPTDTSGDGAPVDGVSAAPQTVLETLQIDASTPSATV